MRTVLNRETVLQQEKAAFDSMVALITFRHMLKVMCPSFSSSLIFSAFKVGAVSDFPLVALCPENMWGVDGEHDQDKASFRGACPMKQHDRGQARTVGL